MLYAQTAGKLRKFLEAMLQKSGKIRGLIREIDENYAGSAHMMQSCPYYPSGKMIYICRDIANTHAKINYSNDYRFTFS